MTTKLNSSDAEAWDVYAAAALSATLKDSKSPTQAAEYAAYIADLLLQERQKRRDAHSNSIGH